MERERGKYRHRRIQAEARQRSLQGETIIVERTNFRDTIGTVVIGGRTGPTRSNGATRAQPSVSS